MKKAIFAVLTGALLFSTSSILLANEKTVDSTIIEMCEQQAIQENLMGEEKDQFIRECIELSDNSSMESEVKEEEETEGC